MTQIIINSPTDSSLSIMLPLNADGSVVFPKWLIDDLTYSHRLVSFKSNQKTAKDDDILAMIENTGGLLAPYVKQPLTVDEMNDGINHHFSQMNKVEL